MELDITWIGAAVAAWLLIEVIKFFAHKKNSSFTEKDRDRVIHLEAMLKRRFEVGYGEKDREEIRELMAMHKIKDESGKPLWYISPEIEKRQAQVLRDIDKIEREVLIIQSNQKEIVKSLQEISLAQHETSMLLKQLIDIAGKFLSK